VERRHTGHGRNLQILVVIWIKPNLTFMPKTIERHLLRLVRCTEAYTLVVKMVMMN